jgi:hypothetical protein
MVYLNFSQFQLFGPQIYPISINSESFAFNSFGIYQDFSKFVNIWPSRHSIFIQFRIIQYYTHPIQPARIFIHIFMRSLIHSNLIPLIKFNSLILRFARCVSESEQAKVCETRLPENALLPSSRAAASLSHCLGVPPARRRRRLPLPNEACRNRLIPDRRSDSTFVQKRDRIHYVDCKLAQSKRNAQRGGALSCLQNRSY